MITVFIIGFFIPLPFAENVLYTEKCIFLLSAFLCLLMFKINLSDRFPTEKSSVVVE